MLAWAQGQVGDDTLLTLAVMKDAGGVEFLNPARWVAEDVLEDLVIVFAEERRFEREFAGEFREAQRKAGDFELAEDAIVVFSHRAPRTQLRMLHRLLDAQHRRVRHAIGVELLQRRLLAALRLEPLLDNR